MTAAPGKNVTTDGVPLGFDARAVAALALFLLGVAVLPVLSPRLKRTRQGTSP